MPCPLPPSVRELLTFCGGFSALEEVDFTELAGSFSIPEIFPFGHPIMGDGCGNFWVVDLTPSSTEWGPIYFACHDPAVILYQAARLEDLLTELFRGLVPPHESAVFDVAMDRLFQVDKANPGVLEHDAALSGDETLQAFARELDTDWQFIDLRNAPVGMGFAWGRYGPETEVRRCGYDPIFAYRKPEPKKGFLSGLFGKKS